MARTFKTQFYKAQLDSNDNSPPQGLASFVVPAPPLTMEYSGDNTDMTFSDGLTMEYSG